MRTVAHISDLHFGRIDPVVAEALVSDLHDRPADVLVVSGDFTQRGRSHQYRQAAEYLTRLPSPRILIPGNHDVPLWDVTRRVLFPLRRYRRHITKDLRPEFVDDELLVLGVNTARSFTRTSGWMSRRQLDHVSARAAAHPRQFKIVVTHHPFIAPPMRPESDVLLRADRALARMAQSGVDMLLAGHLHLAYHDDVRTAFTTADRSILSVQAGTAASTRLRGEPNAYNRITIASDSVVIAVRTWNGTKFQESRVTRWERVEGIWRQMPPVTAAMD